MLLVLQANRKPLASFTESHLLPQAGGNKGARQLWNRVPCQSSRLTLDRCAASTKQKKQEEGKQLETARAWKCLWFTTKLTATKSCDPWKALISCWLWRWFTIPAGMMLGFFSPCCGVLDHQPVASSGQADHGTKPKVRAGAQAMHLLLSTDPEGLLVGCFLPCKQNFTYPMGSR